jgi:predicted metal-dependent hydrolase
LIGEVRKSEKTIGEMKPQLLLLLEKKNNQMSFSPDTILETLSFRLKIVTGDATDNYYMNLKEGILSISCPKNTDYEAPAVQSVIKEFVGQALRYEANRLFPPKVKFLAGKYGFRYANVKVNKSRSRWGSCSSQKMINLSYYCMLLPEYLLDFVILHELCHTLEMNHGERFWLLLDRVTGNRARELTHRLKAFKTSL